MIVRGRFPFVHLDLQIIYLIATHGFYFVLREVSLNSQPNPSAENRQTPEIGIVMGSDSDLQVMEETAAVLRQFDIPFEITVASAHRSPRRAAEYATSAKQRGIKVIIAGAGHAAHLAGAMAAYTSLPVIGVPIDSSAFQGLDALFSTVEMPPGIPVATVAVGKPGARNAGILAVQILALADPVLAERLDQYKQNMAAKVEQKAKKLESSI